MKFTILAVVFILLCLSAEVINYLLGNQDPGIAAIFGLVWGGTVAGPVTFMLGIKIKAFD